MNRMIKEKAIFLDLPSLLNLDNPVYSFPDLI
jgi:hypothetical protein